MIAFPRMLIDAAKKAGIAVPENINNFEPAEFPHWHVFTLMQLGQPMPYLGCHWDNAKVIADIPIEEIYCINKTDIIDRGFQVGFPIR